MSSAWLCPERAPSAFDNEVLTAVGHHAQCSYVIAQPDPPEVIEDALITEGGMTRSTVKMTVTQTQHANPDGQIVVPQDNGQGGHRWLLSGQAPFTMPLGLMPDQKVDIKCYNAARTLMALEALTEAKLHRLVDLMKVD